MRRLEVWPFYPFLFAIYPIINLYANNVGLVSVTVTLPALAIALVATLLAYLVGWLVFKNWFKAGIWLAVGLILFFSFGFVLTSLGDILRNLGVAPSLVAVLIRNRYLFLAYGGILLLTTFILFYKGRRAYVVAPYLNIVAVILIIIPILRISINELKTTVISPSMPYKGESIKLSADKHLPLPDIYYIILDGYGSVDALQECYGYDNGKFVEDLTQKGFTVNKASQSNYLTTILSLSSSLNMDYLNTPEASVEDNRIETALKSIGYKVVWFPSGYEVTHTNRMADINYGTSSDLEEFRDTLLTGTMVGPFVKSQFLSGEQVLDVFDKLGKIPAIKGPKFTFAHIVSPHPPYLFDRDGNSIPAIPLPLTLPNWSRKLNNGAYAYVEQVQFLNKQVERLVDIWIHQSDVPPIIILQGDHGPYCTDIFAENQPDQISTKYARTRSGILNAYYFPGIDLKSVYPSISPVNSFRVVMNEYFGANMGLLEDKTYYLLGDKWIKLTFNPGNK